MRLNKGINYIRLTTFLLHLIAILVLTGCSSTGSESRNYLAEAEGAPISSTKMYVDISRLIRSLPKSSGLYTLHSRPEEVKGLFWGAAGAFGFREVALEEATYQVKLRSVYPDGGLCEEAVSSSLNNISFATSVLTFGILPATNTHCFVVKLSLYEKIEDEWLLIDNFESNAGRVDVYGGANDVDNYQLTVTVRDEARAIEASMTELLSRMLKQGAFE